LTVALVTGGRGFAGSHLVAALTELGAEVSAPAHGDLDVLDAEAVRHAVASLAPASVYHLAGFASPGRSWAAPRDALRQNVEGTLSVLEAVRTEAPDAKVLIVGSGEVYGPPARLPVDEQAPLRPQNPYAVSKAACDLLGGQYADGHGLHVVRTRSFNHAGPGQSDEYVLGTLTRQVAEAELDGHDEVVLRTGSTDSARDFTDVRDVVRAYTEAVELEPDAYNVCSGVGVTVAELIELVGANTELRVRHEIDPERVRSHEVKEIRGSSERLRELTGWQPEIPLRQTVSDAIDAWRSILAKERTGRPG
jgi:GDP-4-dehydro-6-deoxy-D-mannose reductase